MEAAFIRINMVGGTQNSHSSDDFKACAVFSCYHSEVKYTVRVLSFRTDRSGQTVQTQIRV